jgi:hypothetical protein
MNRPTETTAADTPAAQPTEGPATRRSRSAATGARLVAFTSPVRALIGVGATFMPAATLKSYGVETDISPLMVYLCRLFGVREIALATGTSVSRGPAQALWLQLGIACDLVDAAAAIQAARQGIFPKRGALQATLGPAIAITIAAYALATHADRASADPPN